MSSTKAQLETRLQHLQSDYDKIARDHNALIRETRAGWENTAYYREMQERVRRAEGLEEFYRKAYERAEAQASAARNEARQVFEDNKRLCGDGYTIGCTEQSSDEAKALRKENALLTGRLQAKEQTIQYLRELIRQMDINAGCGYGVSGMDASPSLLSNPARGRKKSISGETETRVRQLKAEGLSFRSIAEAEGISVGSVSKILKSQKTVVGEKQE